MFSLNTKLTLVPIVTAYNGNTLDLLINIFNLQVPVGIAGQPAAKAAKANVLFTFLRDHGSAPGPLGKTNEKDALQFIIDKFYDENNIVPPAVVDFFNDDPPAPIVAYEDYFSDQHPRLTNHLRQDGYIIKERQITPLMPVQLIAANVESELERLLRKFGFLVSLGHLEQGIQSHGQSNWAAANAQFRTFLESLLMDLSRLLVPTSVVIDYGQAMTQLSNLNPPFLSTILNEVKTNANPNLNFPFINGLFKRYHPQGSHPGLSDQEDCTFRYHLAIVFARYLLDRLENRP